MHTHTLLYKILVEDVLGEAKTPSISDDFKSQWPKVLAAINLVKRTGRDQELTITGKSHKYENYESGDDVKIKITVVKSEGNAVPGQMQVGAEYRFQSSSVLNSPVKSGLIKASRFMDPMAIYKDFMGRMLKASGDISKTRALKKGLVNKMKKYGAPESWLTAMRNDIDKPVENADDLRLSIGKAIEDLSKKGALARGEMTVFAVSGISDLQWKALFFHELTHAFDPKVHLPHRIFSPDPNDLNYYMIDPLELDASLNGFQTVAADFPDEFNTAINNVVKKGINIQGDSNKKEFMAVVEKYQDQIDSTAIETYLEELLSLYSRIKSLSLNDGGGNTGKKFMQKLVNILAKPKEQFDKPLRDRLTDYKGSKKKDESQGFWDSPTPIASIPAPLNNATPDVMDDSLLQEVLRDTFGPTNGAYNYGRMAYGDKRITPQNKSFKQYPEVLAMCKNIIQRGVAGLSASEANRAVYLVALIITGKIISLEFSLRKLTNSKTMLDDGLLARLLKVAIEMEF